MIPSPPKQATFIIVKDNASKQIKLCQLIHTLFFEGEKLLILGQSEAACAFIDELLWKFPAEGFCPHKLSLEPTKERVVITHVQCNLNKAGVLINLCPEATVLSTQFTSIYDLMDQTHPKKMEASLNKKQFYEKLGFIVNLNNF